MPKFAGSTKPLQPAGSLILDVTRFGAAGAVVVGHLTNSPYSVGWPYLLRMAIGAVAVFFVLSGFVIRLVTTMKPVTLRTYAVDRFSRIFSVMIPALVLTVGAAVVLHRFPSSRLDGPIPFSIPIMGAQVFANTTFTAELWGIDIPVSFNTVFWSLSYEWFYYCFYGAVFFGRGMWRWIIPLVLCLIAGPPMVMLLPLWLLGCGMHDLYQYLRTKPQALWGVSGSIVVAGLAAFALRHVGGSMRRHFGSSAAHFMLAAVKHLADQHHLHLLQRASPLAYFVGVPAAVILLWLLLAVDQVRMKPDHVVVRWVRRVADSTFALYLMHLPILMLLVAYLPYDRSSSAQKIGVLLAVMTMAIFMDKPLNALKKESRAIWHAKSMVREKQTV